MITSVRIGVWSGAVVAVGYLLTMIPNVEGVSITIALAGATLGARAGFWVGLFGEGLYSLLNPWGPPGIVLFLSQVIGMSSVGVGAGVMQRYLQGSTVGHRVMWGAFGVAGSILFDAITTVTMPFMSGMNDMSVGVILTAQIPFTAVKAVSNALLFTLAFVPLRDRLRQVLEASPLRGAK